MQLSTSTKEYIRNNLLVFRDAAISKFKAFLSFLECENKICVFTQLYIANMKLGKNPSAHKLSLTNGIQIICNI